MCGDRNLRGCYCMSFVCRFLHVGQSLYRPLYTRNLVNLARHVLCLLTKGSGAVVLSQSKPLCRPPISWRACL